jgi:superfamily II DNA or RNA helicase
MTVQTRTREEKERAATALQDDLIDRAVVSATQGRDSLIEAPTGAGKSRMYTRLAKTLGEHGYRIFVAAHRKNLVTQGADNYDKWNEARIGETTIGMNGEMDQRGQTVFSTIQTASSEKSLAALQKYDVLIIDEAHHATEDHEQYNAVLAKMMKDNPNLLVIGVTATPPEQRKGLHPKLERADHHVATFEQVVEAGLVVIPDTVRPNILLRDGRTNVEDLVERHRADPRSAEIEGGITRDMRALLPDNWTEVCADMFDRHLHDRRSLGFQERIKEAEELREELGGRGYNVATIHSRVKNADKVLRDFRHGAYDALMSVDMISEGYDVPACEGVLLTKHQTSKKELQQIYGRISRGLGGETERTRLPLLVDLGASTRMHGDLGAIAQVQSLRGDIERDAVTPHELLPGKSTRAFSPWVPLSPVRPDAPQVYGTSIDGRLIYAAETAKGFVAVTTEHHQKKGDKVELFVVPGAARKGVVDPDRLGAWMRDRIPTNERELAQMTARSERGMSRLESLLKADFDRNGPSITRMVQMMALPPVPKGQDIRVVTEWGR